MNEKLNPLINSTYPAAMAGLCLAFLGISQNQLNKISLHFLLSVASLFFITSSSSIFVLSVFFEWDTGNKEKEIITFLWKMGRWSFLFGIIFLLIAIVLVNYYLWISDFYYWITNLIYNLI